MLKVVDFISYTPLHIACLHGHHEGVNKILSLCSQEDKETILDDIDCIGYTPLHIACLHGHHKVVNAILLSCSQEDKEKVLKAKDFIGCTPLHCACEGGDKSVVDLLIQKKADCYKRNNERRTPLHIACLHGHYKVVDTILSCSQEDRKKMLKITDHKGYTPLHCACEGGNENIVKLLLEREADITNRDNDGLNPLEVAVEEGHENVAMAIVNSKHWQTALRNYTMSNEVQCHQCIDNNNNKFTTPMRRIIKSMPDVAKNVFDRCYEIQDYYEFLEDFDI